MSDEEMERLLGEQARVRAAIDAAHAWELDRTLEIAMDAWARQAKGKARLNAYEQLLAADQASDKLPETTEIHIPAGPRLGDVVVEAEGVAKGYGERLLFEDLTFALPPGGIVGVIGPNGPARRRFSASSSATRSPTPGGCGSARRSRSPTSTRAAPRCPATSRYGR